MSASGSPCTLTRWFRKSSQSAYAGHEASWAWCTEVIATVPVVINGRVSAIGRCCARFKPRGQPGERYLNSRIELGIGVLDLLGIVPRSRVSTAEAESDPRPRQLSIQIVEPDPQWPPARDDRGRRTPGPRPCATEGVHLHGAGGLAADGGLFKPVAMGASTRRHSAHLVARVAT
jgi:hypothetical protein